MMAKVELTNSSTFYPSRSWDHRAYALNASKRITKTNAIVPTTRTITRSLIDFIDTLRPTPHSPLLPKS